MFRNVFCLIQYLNNVRLIYLNVVVWSIYLPPESHAVFVLYIKKPISCFIHSFWVTLFFMFQLSALDLNSSDGGSKFSHTFKKMHILDLTTNVCICERCNVHGKYKYNECFFLIPGRYIPPHLRNKDLVKNGKCFPQQLCAHLWFFIQSSTSDWWHYKTLTCLVSTWFFTLFGQSHFKAQYFMTLTQPQFL